MENLALFILEEDADAGEFVDRRLCLTVVIEDFTGGQLLGAKRDVVVEVEVALLGRDPGEAPAHTLFECLQHVHRGARCDYQRHIMLRGAGWPRRYGRTGRN